MGSGKYEDLTDQEIEAFVEVLKDFRIHTNGVHGCTPYTLTRTDYRIHMKWGQTLPFSFLSGTMNFGEYIYPNYADVDDRLYELYRQQRTVRKGR